MVSISRFKAAGVCSQHSGTPHLPKYEFCVDTFIYFSLPVSLVGHGSITVFFKLLTCWTGLLPDPVSASRGGAEGKPGGGIWERTCQSQVEAEEAQRGGKTGQEEGGRGWREEHPSARLHQAVLWRDSAGTTIVCVCVCTLYVQYVT